MSVFHVWDHTFDNPQAHLDFEETLLEHSESTGSIHIRFWESPSYFVVLGRSNKPETEVNLPYCNTHNIPVLRRCSGGGTVLQGPGCLNIALIFPMSQHANLKTISSTTQWIMHTHAAVCRSFFQNIEVKGISDLVWENKKFSGNAQRRKLKSILFHGTFLTHFDLSMISDALLMPSKAPEYRQNREHLSFICNLPVSHKTLKEELFRGWEKAIFP
jgi:lipoate-protein ligase A